MTEFTKVWRHIKISDNIYYSEMELFKRFIWFWISSTILRKPFLFSRAPLISIYIIHEFEYLYSWYIFAFLRCELVGSLKIYYSEMDRLVIDTLSLPVYPLLYQPLITYRHLSFDTYISLIPSLEGKPTLDLTLYINLVK